MFVAGVITGSTSDHSPPYCPLSASIEGDNLIFKTRPYSAFRAHGSLPEKVSEGKSVSCEGTGSLDSTHIESRYRWILSETPRAHLRFAGLIMETTSMTVYQRARPINSAGGRSRTAANIDTKISFLYLGCDSGIEL